MRRMLIVLAAATAAVLPGAAPAAAVLTAAVGTHATASPSGWSVTKSPNPTIHTGQLFWVSCPAAKSCMAVGASVNATGVGVNLAEQWNGASWRIVPVPTPPGATYSGLLGISCTAASACIAVGSSVTSAGAVNALAERWDGTRWRIQATPAKPQGGSLNAVSCTSATACTAVGSSPAGPLAERWDGTRWSVQSTPNPPQGGGLLSGVSCPSASACTAVGASQAFTPAGKSLVEQWNGTTWTIQASPNPHGNDVLLTSVSCWSASACDAVGTSSAGTLAEGWLGASWSIQPTPFPSFFQLAFLNSVACTAASGCTAVGTWVDNGGNVKTLVATWHGGAWSGQDGIDEGQSELIGVACTPGRASACTAVGYTDNANSPEVLVEQSSCCGWSTQAAPDPLGAASSFMNSVACWSRSACIAVGATTNEFRRQIAESQRWNGRSWAMLPTPSPKLGRAVFGGALNGISCSSSSACTAVGASAYGQPLVERWNGVNWSIQHTPSVAPGSFLNSVSCPTRTACTAVGISGRGKVLIERWNGTKWVNQPAPNPRGNAITLLAGVSCPSSVVCLAVGGRNDRSFNAIGTLAERWNGKIWRIVPTLKPTGFGAFLNGVACTSKSACTAVGSSGPVTTLAERWNGSKWSVQATPNPAGGQNTFLASVSCPTSSACTAFGLNLTGSGPFTLAERWGGHAWRIQPTPALLTVDIGFPGLGCATSSTCFAVASYKNNGDPSLNLIEQWNQTAHASQPATRTAGIWNRQPVPASERYLELSGRCFVLANTLVGTAGSICRSTP